MDLVEGRDDSVLAVNSVCPREQSAWGTTTKDILLSCTRTKVVGGIRFTISKDTIYIFFTLFKYWGRNGANCSWYYYLITFDEAQVVGMDFTHVNFFTLSPSCAHENPSKWRSRYRRSFSASICSRLGTSTSSIASSIHAHDRTHQM